MNERSKRTYIKSDSPRKEELRELFRIVRYAPSKWLSDYFDVNHRTLINYMTDLSKPPYRLYEKPMAVNNFKIKNRQFVWALTEAENHSQLVSKEQLIVDLIFFSKVHWHKKHGVEFATWNELLLSPNLPKHMRGKDRPHMKVGDTWINPDGLPFLSNLAKPVLTIEEVNRTISSETVVKKARKYLQWLDAKGPKTDFGVDDCYINFVYTSRARMLSHMNAVEREIGKIRRFTFCVVPDWGDDHFYPLLPDPSGFFFDTPLERVGGQQPILMETPIVQQKENA